MKALSLSALLAAATLGGCADRSAQLVGVWKYDLALSSNPTTLADQLASAIGSGSELEFNDKGKYRITLAVFQVEGEYRLNGDLVTLTGDKDKTPTRFRLSKDGNRLTSEKEFPTDGELVWVKSSDQSRR